MKNQVSAPVFATEEAMPFASEAVFSVHWKPVGEQALPTSSDVVDPENMTIRFFSFAICWTAKPTEETGTSTMAWTPFVEPTLSDGGADVRFALMVRNQ